MNNTTMYKKMKNEILLSIEKIYINREKAPYYN